jgi:hypothetical protein
MSETTTQRRPGRPKKSVSPESKQATKPTPKKNLVRRKQEVISHAEFEIPKNAGVVTLLPQKGVTIYDEENDTVREIRYCPNEPSIYTDEQGDRAKREAVVFRDGRIFVPKNKPQLRKFLELHPDNMDNGGRLFRKVDKKADAEKELQREFLQTDAIAMVRDKAIEDLLPIAIYFGYNINASTSDIRFNLLQKAKKNPQEFIEAFDSPQVQVRSVVQQAKEYQFISAKDSGVHWFDSNQLIVSVPAGMDPLDVMTRFCMTEKGAAVLSNLEEKLEKLA